jgi:death-on-curing protein
MSYANQELYPTLIEKVAALGFSLINNHPFIDGNKHIGHAALEVTLLMNGYKTMLYSAK